MAQEANPSGSRLAWVDHTETYGRHILDEVVAELKVETCLDLGCGWGLDLGVVRRRFPGCRAIGVDFGDWNRAMHQENGIEAIEVNVEQEPLPLENESVDLVIANQVMEHLKEIYWVNHEVFRTLRVGGVFFLGVPNILSLHNRLLGVFGVHPTNSKLVSAHVRGFSKKDTLLFYEQVASDFCTLSTFRGSQFYPFPRTLARLMANTLPSMAFSIFFVFKKTAPYNGEFINRLREVPLETNYYTGPA